MLTSRDVNTLVNCCKESGLLAINCRLKKDFTVSTKSDGSKISNADLMVDDYLQKIISKVTPQVPIISEESNHKRVSVNQDQDYFWLIDPIDGTSNFCRGEDQFTINIALLKNNIPIFGVIHAPLYQGGKTAYLDNDSNIVIDSFMASADQITPIQDTIITSRSASDEDIGNFMKKNLYYEKKQCKIKKISSSVKFFELLEGNSDLFLMLHETKEWDIAAGDALLRAAGGGVYELNNSNSHQQLEYGKSNFLNNYLTITSNYGKKTYLKL